MTTGCRCTSTPARDQDDLPDGRRVALDVDTAYPRDGQVAIRFREDSGGPVDPHAARPGLGTGARARASRQAARPRTTWPSRASSPCAATGGPGDVVELHLPLEPRLTAADPRIDAVRGCLAVERGPEVLCLESADLAAVPEAGGDVGNVRLDTSLPAARQRGADGGDAVSDPAAWCGVALCRSAWCAGRARGRTPPGPADALPRLGKPRAGHDADLAPGPRPLKAAIRAAADRTMNQLQA